MDFSKLDSRTRAEKGVPMQILDPWTGEPIMDGDKPCRVIVRGTASRTAQAQMRERQRAAMEKKPKDGEEEARVMEDIHDELCESAAPFIVGFENVSNGDKPATADDARWFLDLFFPEMGVKEDADGNAILDKDGNPVFEMKNRPFASQIIDFASSQANRLGNGKKG